MTNLSPIPSALQACARAVTADQLDEARLGLARSKPPPKRERIRAHNRAAQEAMRRGLSSGDVDL